MKKMILILCLIISLTGCQNINGNTMAKYQKMQLDFDRERLQDISEIFSLAEEFKQKTGAYPLEDLDQDQPTVVIFHNKAQSASGNPNIYIDLKIRGLNQGPKKINIVDESVFYESLEDGLKRDIDRFYDPQQVPMTRACAYIYIEFRGVIEVYTSTHHPFNFTRPLAEYDNKIGYTNSPEADPKLGIWNWSVLNKNPHYLEIFTEAYIFKLSENYSNNIN